MDVNDYLPLSCWASEDIPANKLVDKGVVNLTNTELLSIIIGGGTKDTNSLELARKVLYKNDNTLRTLSSQTTDELTKIDGIGKATASKILAALELGRRLSEERKSEKVDLSTAVRIYNNMYPSMVDLEIEEFWLLMLDNRFNLIKKKKMFVGGITEVLVDVRLICKEAIINNATQIVVLHNHPSGNITPSSHDDEVTTNLQAACKTLRIRFSDHVIIGDGVYYSYSENGKL